MGKVIFVIGVMLTLMTSCKKDDHTAPTTTSSNSNGTKQLRAVLSGNDTVYTLFYKNNKLDSLVIKTKGFYNFLYENNSITMFITSDGEIPQDHKKFFTALLDTDGLTYSSSQPSAGENSTYLYENNQLIEVNSTDVSPGEPTTYRKNQYKWDNGNIVRMINGIDTLYYEYSTKLNKDFWHIGIVGLLKLYRIDNVIFRNPVGVENKNLVKSIYNSKKQIITSFDYQLDDAGYVVKSTTKNFDYTTGSQTVKTGEATFVWK
jgi:hypothetical protein